jgi:hypothetical protein
MEIGSERTARSVSFGLVIVGQVAIAAGLVAMLVITIRGAAEIPDPAVRKLLLRLAWLSLVLLLLILLTMVWAVIRHIRYRLGPARPFKPTPYVNAWELAGKRFKLEEDDREEEDSDPWDPDGNDAGGGP